MSQNDSILKMKMKAILIGSTSVPNDGNLEEAYHLVDLYGERDTVEEALSSWYNMLAKRWDMRRQYKILAMYDRFIVSCDITSDSMTFSNVEMHEIPNDVKYVYFWYLEWYNLENPVLRQDFFECMGFTFDEDEAFTKASAINKDLYNVVIDKVAVDKGPITAVAEGIGLTVNADEICFDRSKCEAFTKPEELYDYCMRFCLAEERTYDPTGKLIAGRTIINDEPQLLMEDYFNPDCYKLLMRRNDPLGFANGLGWHDDDVLETAWAEARAKSKYKTQIGLVG